MIEIENLYKNYGTLPALRGISLAVPRGQVLGLLGPNGAGKSTTLRILTGFLEASSGDVRVGGHSVQEHAIATRKLIGYLPESTPLYENMLVFDYLRFVAQARDIPQSECLATIRRAAERCDILEFIHRPIGEISKGQHQRVGLAMAILDDPEVLILDEPTSGLDPNQIVGIRDIIRELGREKTIIFSTHILSEAEATCDRVVIINRGEIVADGSMAELQQRQQASLLLRLELGEGQGQEAVTAAFAPLAQPLQAYGENALGEGAGVTCTIEGAEALVSLQGSHSGSNQTKQAIKDIVKKNDWFMLGMETKSQSLEDIFRELTN